MNELLLMLRGVMALAVPRQQAGKLAEADHALELERNSGLRNASTAEQERHLAGSRDLVNARLRLLRHAVVSSFLLIASGLAVGLVVHSVLTPDARGSLGLSVGSLFLFAWATLGRLGWAGQSLGGDTSVERLDQFVFCLFYWLATVAGTVALA